MELEDQIRKMINDRINQITSQIIISSTNIAASTSSIQKVYKAVLSDNYIEQLNKQLLEIELMKIPKITIPLSCLIP